MRHIAKDLAVTLCGLVTSLITAGLLALIEVKFHFAVYAFTFWFIIPIGATASGWAASSGYIWGTKLLKHPLHRAFLVNIMAVSVATYFALNYMVYSTLTINDQHVRDVLTFSRYLSLLIQNRKMSLIGLGSFHVPGWIGYVEAAIQVIGFAAGGSISYKKVASEPFCGRCGMYLSLKRRMTAAFGGLTSGSQQVYAKALIGFQSGDASGAIAALDGYADWRDAAQRVIGRVWHCAHCGYDAFDLEVLARNGNRWQTVPTLHVRGVLNPTAAGNVAIRDADSAESSPSRFAASLAVLACAFAALVVIHPGGLTHSPELVAEATRYLNGTGVPRDYAKAAELSRQAAEQGNPFGMNLLAGLYLEGKGVNRDPQQARFWLERSAKAGNSGAMYVLGEMYATGQGVSRDDRNAAEWYEKAVRAGNVEAMNSLGTMLLEGRGMPQDLNAARDLFARAAAHDNRAAIHNLGVVALRSKPPDYSSAMEHFQRGAEVNYAPSVKALASMYYLGQGQPRDVDKAIATIMPLATGNDPEAMYTIAAMYLGSRNLRAGREWLQKSSAAGNAQATQMLAMLNGRGVRTSGRR